MTSKERQDAIIKSLSAMSETNEAVRLMKELFSIRLERYKTELVKADNPDFRGRAQELNELITKIFESGIDNL